MALTRQGDALTREHQRQQVFLAARAAEESDDFWPELRTGDPMAWAYSQALLLDSRKRQSERLTATYLSEYGLAETGRPITVDRPRRNLSRLIGTTVSTGVRPVENLVDGTSTLTEADVRRRFNEIIAAEVQRTSREMIADSSKSNRVAWRRVTDGKPCAFCAMLASRGPVYTESTVTSRFDGLRYHRGCGCTAEPWFGDWSDWVPSGREQPLVDAYFQAALEADAADETRVASKTIRDIEGTVLGRSEDNILWRMRRNNPALFSDGVRPRK